MAITWDDEIDPNLSKEVHLGGLEKQYGLDNGVLKGLWNTESANGSNMRTKLSSAKGHFQFINSTAKEYGLKNPDDFYESADAAARYLKDLKEQFGGDMVKAIAAYKAGPSAVQKNGIAAPAMGPNADAAYINKVLGAPNEAKIVWDDVSSGLEKQLATFQQNYNKENLGGLPEVAKEVREMPWLKQAAIAAGHETTGLLRGLDTMGVFGRYIMGDPNAPADYNKLISERNEENRLYKPFKEASGVSPDVVGSALPYFVTGATGGPVAERAAGSFINAVEAPVKYASRESKSLLNLGTERLIKSSSPPVSQFGKALSKDFTQPILDKAAARKLQPSLPDPYYKGSMKRILGSTALGAAEGALNVDSSLKIGAASGAMGGMTGQLLRKATNVMPDYNSKPQRELLDWYESKGGMPSHGLDTGSNKLQNFESQLEKSGQYADAAALYKAENQIVDNRIAYEAMGIDPSKFEHMTPADLAAHQESLQAKYRVLEKNTSAVFSNADKKQLLTHVRELSKWPSIDGERNARVAKKYVAAITGIEDVKQPLTKVPRKPSSVNGQTFQTVRSSLQADITKAYKDGDINLVHALKPIQETLDAAVEKGVREGAGEATVAEWKDLNNKYAMSHMVYEHALSPSGVDAKKLYSHLASTDAKRLFLEQGNPQLNDLQRLAKVGYMKSHQNTSMGGLKNPGGLGPMQQFITTSGTSMLPLVNRLGLSMYKLGYPSRYGLLNMGSSRPKDVGFLAPKLPNLWEGPQLYTRAIDQGSSTPEQIYNTYMEYFGSQNDKPKQEK